MKRKISKKTLIFLFISLLFFFVMTIARHIPLTEINACIFDVKLIGINEDYH